MKRHRIYSFVAAGLLGISVFAGAPLMAGAQSLWADNNNNDTRSLYSDYKARGVGDILTIIISESTRTTTNKSMSNSKEGSTTLGAGTGIFRFLEAAGASQSDEFTANGAASAVNSVSGRITVTVVDVEPNGNFVVEGTQSIWQNRDEHKITFRGIVRPRDISAANTVASSLVADATVHFDGKGPLNAKQRQGILTQILNFLF
ncbi:MAG: flagellar basal body L-ring protein FlgH [Selenomonadaceae bacterium]|nr:flagellar basal body L-ring protein FlgH [Selenomonadaceae bacterium]